MTTLSNAARSAAADAVVDLLDGGTIEFQTAADAVIATLNLPTPAFGAAANGVATAVQTGGVVGEELSVAAGTVTKAVFKAAGGAVIFTDTVTAEGGGGDIEFPNPSFVVGEPLRLTSYTYTQPASA